DDPDPLENIATVVVSPDGFPNVLTATDSWTTNLFQPGVSIVKAGDELSKVGDIIHYVITVTNTGSADAPPLDGSVHDSIIGTVDVFTGLVSGDYVTFEYDYTVQPGDDDPEAEGHVPFVNVATVIASPVGFPNILEVSDSWTTLLVHPEIDIVKTVDPTIVTVGEQVIYTITITNTGDIALQNITVTDTIMGDLSASFVDVLDPGASDTQTFPYVTSITDPEILENTATVHANPILLPNDITDSDTAILEIIQRHDETAWGYLPDKAITFDEVDSKFANWGWTNGLLDESRTYILDLYAGAGGNDIDSGLLVGTVTVEFNKNAGTVDVTYETDSSSNPQGMDYEIKDAHLWVGTTMLPLTKKGKSTNSPGQFPDDDWYVMNGDYIYSFHIDGLEGEDIYVAAHAVVSVPNY
ncbi:MAG: DUF11 domain-containing protein, partial [Clostridiales bacterium]|nr:DUF11 domain-containing protein [Clostridiales bacterium]